MAINPGKLDKLIEIEHPYSGSKDAFGQVQNNYTSSMVWANVVQQSGAVSANNGYLRSNATYVFTVRNRSTLSEANKIIWLGHKYNVSFIEEPWPKVIKLTATRAAKGSL